LHQHRVGNAATFAGIVDLAQGLADDGLLGSEDAVGAAQHDLADGSGHVGGRRAQLEERGLELAVEQHVADVA
jgi:hypothetical protein